MLLWVSLLSQEQNHPQLHGAKGQKSKVGLAVLKMLLSTVLLL